jgi:hypothetical protein
MRRTLPLIVLFAAFGAPALGQPAKIDLGTLPNEIKTLDWKSVDLSSASPLDQCRSLMFLNQALDEIGAQTTAEADLMSQFIDVSNLGPQFVAMPAPVDANPLTFQSAQKMALALLRGPQAQSSYATALTDTSADMLTAYQQMYSATCQRKWGSVVESRHQVRAMSAFLESSGKMQAYNAWVPGAVAQRVKEQETAIAQQQAAQQAQQSQEQAQMIARQRAQMQQMESQQAASAQANQQLQQALCAAQQNQSASANQGAPAPNAYYPNYYYGGVGVGYAATGAWYRNAAYRGAATAATEARYSSWHGGGFRR